MYSSENYYMSFRNVGLKMTFSFLKWSLIAGHVNFRATMDLPQRSPALTAAERAEAQS